ncbi:hypothetical protein PUR29_36810 [Methylobacterium ajmalii]|uniref:Uncharacterized protein n=1 Tax=Methylobacterium ajmalii TaxID=2738439 RepID=A0ABV0A6I0_9HYPH
MIVYREAQEIGIVNVPTGTQSARQKSMDHPFWRARKEYRQARIEFARFVHSEQYTLLDDFNAVDRDKILSKWYSFFVYAGKDAGKLPYINEFSSTIQISSGLGSTGRYDSEGKWLREHGLSLVYSFGFTGEVAVILYPFASDGNNWKPEEDNLLLAVVPSNASKLRKRVKKDLRAMVAYGHVTAIDGQPTLLEKIHVWWIRFSCGRNVDQKWQNAKRVELIYKAFASAGSGSASGIFRLLAPTILAYLLLKFGFDLKTR